MSAYNVVSRAAMAAGQPEDISVVLANLDAIATVLNGGIDNSNINVAAAIAASKLAGYPASIASVLAGDGTWKTVPKTTTSTLAAGPPGSPGDGDIWIATQVAGVVGSRWAFQYNASSPSGAKWEFIGGPHLQTFVGSQESTASSALVELATQQRITITRAGDYIIRYSGQCNATIACSANMQFYDETAGAQVGSTLYTSADASTWRSFGMMEFGLANVSAGHVYSMRYNNGSANGATITYTNRSFSMLPIRIS